MFERFTEQARRALFFARYEVSELELGSTSIDTGHLLLGLIRESEGLTSRLFADAGVALDDVRDEVIRRVPGQPKVPPSTEIPFSARRRTCCSTPRLRDQAGLSITRESHDTPTLVVRRR